MTQAPDFEAKRLKPRSSVDANSGLRPWFRQDKCEQRRRIASSRDGVEAAPVRFASGTGDEGRAPIAPPMNDAAALALINRRLKAPLEAKDVYIHWIEAASSRFIADRYAFLAESTLRNIAIAANAGVAFMNSHATGSLSGPPAQLPFGRTFYGAFTPVQGKAPARTIVGIYMLAGLKPNGASGPSTDDLDRGIRAGTIFDVSVGLSGGDVLCGVCGQNWSDLIADSDDWADRICPHIPGTRRGMTRAQIASQLQKGVTRGRATYTIERATFAEVSAVFDGAVPGAGFATVSKRLASLTTEERAELREAFGELLPDLAATVRKRSASNRAAAARLRSENAQLKANLGASGAMPDANVHRAALRRVARSGISQASKEWGPAYRAAVEDIRKERRSR